MIEQMRHLRSDAFRIVNGRWWRFLNLPFSQSFAMVALYRLERGCYLHFGARWRGLRIGLQPLFALIRPWAGSEINYQAEIGPGLAILHPSLGVVVTSHTTAGERLTLVGGNVIGTRSSVDGSPGRVIIGNHVELGAHSCVLGPANLGSRATVGAHAVVLGDVDEGATVVGAPARPVRSQTPGENKPARPHPCSTM